MISRCVSIFLKGVFLHAHTTHTDEIKLWKPPVYRIFSEQAGLVNRKELAAAETSTQQVWCRELCSGGSKLSCWLNLFYLHSNFTLFFNIYFNVSIKVEALMCSWNTVVQMAGFVGCSEWFLCRVFPNSACVLDNSCSLGDWKGVQALHMASSQQRGRQHTSNDKQ